MAEVELLREPELNEALEALRRGLAKRLVILIIGCCNVHYKGRASSKLEPGDRIVLIKEDGSLQVHRPYGYEPVNWQPPGCVFHTELHEEGLRLVAVRHTPKEHVRITFSKIHLLTLLNLVDSGAFALHATEEDMQRAILLEPSLIEPGLKPITYEKRVEPGFVDVYARDREGRLVVIEIKRKTAGRDAVLQLHKYVQSLKKEAKTPVRGILVAPKLAKGAQKLLVSLNLEYKRVSPKKCAEILERAKRKALTQYMAPAGEERF